MLDLLARNVEVQEFTLHAYRCREAGRAHDRAWIDPMHRSTWEAGRAFYEIQTLLFSITACSMSQNE
jgi:hypothetical protein